MSYLLDTNIVSETVRRNPNKAVIAWLDQLPGEALFVSVLTLGEIRKGIEALSDKRRREKLRLWLEHELPAWFEGRVLPVDLSVADRWGRLLADEIRLGRFPVYLLSRRDPQLHESRCRRPGKEI